MILAPVTPQPPAVVKQLTDTTAAFKQEVVLECAFKGTPTPDIKWFKNKKVIKSKTITYENYIARYKITETSESSEPLLLANSEELLGSPLIRSKAGNLTDEVADKLVVLGQLALSTAWLGLQGVGCGLVTLLQTNADFVPGSHSTLSCRSESSNKSL